MTVNHDSLPVEAGLLPLTIARAGGRGAAVVFVPSAFGVTPDLETQMEELARDARIVVALDPFFREDAGPADYQDMQRVMARLSKLDRERAYRDVRAAIDWTRRQEGVSDVVVVGICFGGPLALRAAADRTADGVVTWHGSRMENALDGAAEMRCPMRLHFGGADPFVSMEVVEKVRAAFRGRDDVDVVVHEGATHGFSHPGSPASYDPKAERAAMDALRELVKR